MISLYAKNYQKYVEMERTEISKKVPTLFVRYEDLVTNPVETLSDIFRFFLNVPSIEGTVIEKRIIDISAKGTSTQSKVYELKKKDYSKFYKLAHAYTAE